MPTQPRDARRLGATLTLMGVLTVNVLATLLLPGLSTDATATTKQVSPAPVRIVGDLTRNSWIVLGGVKAARTRLGRISNLAA